MRRVNLSTDAVKGVTLPNLPAVVIHSPRGILHGYVEKIPTFMTVINHLTGELGVHQVKDQMTVRVLHELKPPELLDYAASQIPLRWQKACAEKDGIPNVLEGDLGHTSPPLEEPSEEFRVPQVQWWDVERAEKVKIKIADKKEREIVEARFRYWSLLPAKGASK